jgi:hypothetical protein
MDLQNCNGSTEHQHQLPAPAKRKRTGVQQKVQAAALERFAFDAAVSLRQACTDPVSGALTMTPQMATAIYRLIGAWDTAADRLRVLRGRGLPASVRSKAPRSPAQIEPLDPA